MPRHILAAAALLVLPLLPALLRAADAPKGDKDLDGTWELVSAVRDGKEEPQDQDHKFVMTIKGDSVTVHVGDETHMSKIETDPSKSPKTLDVHIEDGPQKGKTMKAIYEVKGDELKVCHGDLGSADRPTEFTAKEGSGLTLATLKRVKK